MSVLTMRDAHSSWYTPVPGQENRNIAAEAYQSAIRNLKSELGISSCGTVPVGCTASAKDIFAIAQTATKKYEDNSKEHTGARKWLEKLSHRIMYYSKVFDVLAQHHPEYVALIWGAVKLVLTGVINRAELVQKLSQALIAIADVLPQADLNAGLYQTEYMEAALSRLYTYIILFIRLCVRWYNRGSVGRLFSAVTTPFEVDYQELVEQIQLCSKSVDDLANAGARAEVRHIRTVLELHHAQSSERDAKLLDMQKKFDASMVQLTQVVTASKAITERMSGDVRGIHDTVYRIEFHHVVNFFAPEILPEAALLKVRSFTRRDATPVLYGQNELRVRAIVNDWIQLKGSSLLVVRVHRRAQKQAKELAMKVIYSLKSGGQCVFWDISASRMASNAKSVAEFFKVIIFQILHQDGSWFNSFAEQLNLSKIRDVHTESEWLDLVCLLFSKLPKAYMVIEPDALLKAYHCEPAWVDRFCDLLQTIVDRSSAAGNETKILVVLCGNSYQSGRGVAKSSNAFFTTLQPPIPIPPRLRHLMPRSVLDTKGWKLRPSKMKAGC